MRNWGLILVALTSFIFFVGCEEKKETELVKAQACLDKATSSTALGCISGIANQTNKRAYVLMCSARFLSRGIDESKLVGAIELIADDDAPNNNATSTAISTLAVPDNPDNPTSYDVTFAQDTLNNFCALTESEGLIALASFAVMATATNSLIAGLGVGACATLPFTEACVTTALDGYAGGSDATSIGNTAIANQEVLCGENGLFKDENFCTDLDAAIAGGGDANAIGNSLLNGIANDNG